MKSIYGSFVFLNKIKIKNYYELDFAVKLCVQCVLNKYFVFKILCVGNKYKCPICIMHRYRGFLFDYD